MLSMLLPLGMLVDEVDSALLDRLTAFGASRGGFAHTGRSVQSQPDPATTKNDVAALLAGLEKLDQAIASLG